MQIEIIEPDPGLDAQHLSAIVTCVITEEQKQASFINVIFLKKAALSDLKKQYFDQNVYTDVMAFNLNDPGEAIEGEIYLALEQIHENAQEYGTDLHEELNRVLIHGCLHLCGYEDDKPDLKAQMTALEDKYLSMIKKDRV